ncbi:hypothetical protein N0V88_001493 [Collariella sp. IMI 366227]|nr:hypothetical protein N0V88_001493 [Collariella sp. IMI 366227]
MTDQPIQLVWSAPFRVAHPSRAATKDLQGDKILLPQSALEQLLAASTTAAAPSTHSFTAFDPSNPYSVADARRERTQYRDTYQQLPHPLMFQLINQKNGNAVYAGIREFSAAEGEVTLSSHLLDALGIQEADISSTPPVQEGVVDFTKEEEGQPEDERIRITVKARQLPKGTYVRLRPLEAGYDPDDWKPLLERQLRGNFTTLTKDSMLTIQGAKGEEFQFLADKFLPEGDGICVVDTDLEVDIEPLNEEQARETLRQIAAKAQRAPGTAEGSSVGSKIDIWKEVQGQVLEGDYVDYELPSWDKARPLAIELEIQGDQEVDLFVSPKSARQRALPRDSEHIFGDFSSPMDGVKRIFIEPNDAALIGAECLLISVHGFSLPGAEQKGRPARYTLRAKAADPEGSSTTPIDLTTLHLSPTKSSAKTASNPSPKAPCSSTPTSASATTPSAPTATTSSKPAPRPGKTTGTAHPPPPSPAPPNTLHPPHAPPLPSLLPQTTTPKLQ